MKMNKNNSLYKRMVSGIFISILAFGGVFGLFVNETEAKVKQSADLGEQITVQGTGTGAIPDSPGGIQNPGPPLDISFAFSGVKYSLRDISLKITGIHTFVGDLNLTLFSPQGTEFTVFKYTGATTNAQVGDSSDFTGTYTFNDDAIGNWWDEAAARSAAQPLTSAQYRTSEFLTGDQTNFTEAFAEEDVNGIWTLRVTDGAGGDTGSISSASLTITLNTPPPPGDLDFDGDRISDFVITRNNSGTTLSESESFFFSSRSVTERMKHLQIPDKNENFVPPPSGNGLGWWVQTSSNSSHKYTGLGRPIDFPVPADYDGDGRTDIAVWRPISTDQPTENAFFYIMSSKDNTVEAIDFGIATDDPSVVGDYDGDGKADPATFRCNRGGGPCFFFYRASSGSGNVSTIQWGNNSNSEVIPNPGDFDGDGKNDFCVRVSQPDGTAMFIIYRSLDRGVNYIKWGSNTDIIVPGDFNGNFKNDLAVVSRENGRLVWYVFDPGIVGQTQSSPEVLYYGTQFGLSNDFITPGDYDGDGKTDIAVWRPDPRDQLDYFYVLRSSDFGLTTREWGNPGDYPVANFQVH